MDKLEICQSLDNEIAPLERRTADWIDSQSGDSLMLASRQLNHK
jgi:hypothetical protein